MIPIEEVRSPSPASRAGLRSGDLLMACAGREICDWIDLAYLASGPSIDIEYSRGGRVRRLRLSRRPGTDWGIILSGQAPRTCRRRCVFCFVDQLPPGVRASLRIKDDDIRYSFYQGTYVTLDEEEVRMAISRRLSPVHVSVHSTDPELRGRLLGTGRPEPVVEMLERLSMAGIAVETQIVVVPGWNDGDQLSRTMEILLDITGVASVGVVPVGLTSHRIGLESLRRPCQDEALDILGRCEDIREYSSSSRGTPFAYPSDELFILAGLPIPGVEYYEDCTLQANGIGLLTRLLSFDPGGLAGSGTLFSGVLAAPFLERALQGSHYRVVGVENQFFGPEVGVSGLLSGADIVRTAERTGCGAAGTGRIFLPGVMFSHEGLTVDDRTREDLEGMLGCPVTVADGLEELI